MSLEIRHLRLIHAIAREGTVTGAAKRMHLTQPAASHALGDLEDRLDVKLFNRHSRHMELTPEGERLLETAEAVLEEVRRAEYELEQMKAGKQGVLYVTTECYTCYHWLPPLLKHFQEDFPKIDLQIVPEATTSPFEALLAGEVDLAIVHSEPASADIVLRELFRDELVAVTSPDHPLASKEHLEAEDFAAETLLLHSDPAQSSVVRKVLEPAGVEPERTLLIPLTEAILQSVRAGLGVTVMARWAITPEAAAGSVAPVRLTPEGIFRVWSAALLKRRADAPAMAALLRHLNEHAFAAAQVCAT